MASRLTTLQVGGIASVLPTAITLMILGGAGFFEQGISTEGPLAATGTSLRLSVNPLGEAGTGRTVLGVTSGNCTGTGGVQAKSEYLTIDQDFPFTEVSGTASGVLVTRVDVLIGDMNASSQFLECGFDNTAAGTGTNITAGYSGDNGLLGGTGALFNFRNTPVETGSVITFSTGSLIWQTSEDFQCGFSLSPVGANASNTTTNCRYDIHWKETYWPT